MTLTAMARETYGPASAEGGGRASSVGCKGFFGGCKVLRLNQAWPFLRCERGFCAATMLVLGGGVEWSQYISSKAGSGLMHLKVWLFPSQSRGHRSCRRNG